MNNVCFSVSVCENCPRMLRRDLESAVYAEIEVAGIVRGLLSLVCSADVIPGQFEVRRLILKNATFTRLERFGETRFCSLLAEKFSDTAYAEVGDFSRLALIASSVVDRVIEQVCQPFVSRRRRGISFSCLCP